MCPPKTLKKEKKKKTHTCYIVIDLFVVDYRKWTPQANERKLMEAPYRPPSAPFKGNSNYQTDYLRHQVAPPQSLKPAEKSINSGPFDSTTGYKVEYVKHPIPNKYVKERPAYERNTVPLDGLLQLHEGLREETGAHAAVV